MLEYRAEGLCRNANHLRREELYHCITTGEVLQSTALAFDTERRLRFELGGQRAYMPFEECVDVGPQEEIKDIAVLTRVGRPTCFVITGPRWTRMARRCFCSPVRWPSGCAVGSIWIPWKPAVSFPAR